MRSQRREKQKKIRCLKIDQIAEKESFARIFMLILVIVVIIIIIIIIFVIVIGPCFYETRNMPLKLVNYISLLCVTSFSFSPTYIKSRMPIYAH